LLLLLTAVAAPCRAQIVAPPLNQRAAEAGIAYKWFRRDVTSGQVPDIDWEVATVYGRYGAWDWLTLTAEGGLWEIGADKDLQKFSRWAVGLGLSARVYQKNRWQLFASGTFNEVYDLDESTLYSDERTRSWTLALVANRRFGAGGNRLDVWAGPMFVNDLAEVYAFNASEPIQLETDPTLGIALGTYGVLYEYISGFAYVVYADDAQFRLGVSIRSRGNQP
jgi:hypothetical protein